MNIEQFIVLLLHCYIWSTVSSLSSHLQQLVQINAAGCPSGGERLAYFFLPVLALHCQVFAQSASNSCQLGRSISSSLTLIECHCVHTCTSFTWAPLAASVVHCLITAKRSTVFLLFFFFNWARVERRCAAASVDL